MILKGDLKGFPENFVTFFRIPLAFGTNQIAGFVEYRLLTNWEKNKCMYVIVLCDWPKKPGTILSTNQIQTSRRHPRFRALLAVYVRACVVLNLYVAHVQANEEIK